MRKTDEEELGEKQRRKRERKGGQGRRNQKTLRGEVKSRMQVEGLASKCGEKEELQNTDQLLVEEAEKRGQ